MKINYLVTFIARSSSMEKELVSDMHFTSEHNLTTKQDIDEVKVNILNYCRKKKLLPDANEVTILNLIWLGI